MAVRCNIGKKEKLLRLGVAIILIFAGVAWWPLLVFLGVVLLITGFVGWCPLRAVLGISGCDNGNQIPADTTGTPKDVEDRRRRFK